MTELTAPATKAVDLVKRKCEVIHSVPGPHPGCAEFAPPEEFSCGNRAVVEVEYAYPDQDLDGVVWVHGWLRLCRRDFEEFKAAGDDPYCRMVKIKEMK
jgi:hypothetical protein